MMKNLPADAAYIDELSTEIGCLRTDQVYKLLRLMGKEHTPDSAKGVINQLCYSNRARLIGNTLVPLLLDLPKPDPGMLTAVDIMISLLKKPPIAVAAKKPPAKLVFHSGQEMPPCAVVMVEQGAEERIIHSIEECEDDYIFIFFISEQVQKTKLATQRLHLFVAFEDNTLRFFKGE